jgi:hypothetical protein
MVTILLLAAAAAAAQPSVEAQRLGRELANHGTLAALLPVIKAQEVHDLLASHKNLSAADQARLRRVADGVFARGRERLLTATGRAYAEKLSVADLRKLVAFYRTPVADRAQAALPLVIGETMRSVGKMDFKGDVLAAFCKETGKLCGK